MSENEGSEPRQRRRRTASEGGSEAGASDGEGVAVLRRRRSKKTLAVPEPDSAPAAAEMPKATAVTAVSAVTAVPAVPLPVGEQEEDLAAVAQQVALNVVGAVVLEVADAPAQPPISAQPALEPGGKIEPDGTVSGGESTIGADSMVAPAAKHVPSMSQGQATIEAQLQATPPVDPIGPAAPMPDPATIMPSAPVVARPSPPPLLSQTSYGNSLTVAYGTGIPHGNGPAMPPTVVKPMDAAPPPMHVAVPMPAPSQYQYQTGMPSPSQYQYQSPPSPHPPGVQEVVLDGCQAGVGLGLDDKNRVTMLKPDGRAAVSGLFGLGDRIVTVDGEVLGNRQLQVLLQVKERHVFGVERLATTPRAMEEAFPDVARRMSMTDDPSSPRSPRSPRSPGSKAAGMVRTMSGNLPGRRKSNSRPSSEVSTDDGHMGDGPAIPPPI